jgi:acyl-coenzyme A thioesterase PaaI-like protein
MRELQFFTSGPAALFSVDVLRQCEDGVAGSMTFGPGSVGPGGGPALGALGVLVDEALGYALMGSLAPGAWSISTEIWMDLLGPLPPAGESLTIRTRAVVEGSFVTGEVHDASGRLVVRCSQRGREVPPAVDPGGATSAARSALAGLPVTEDLEVLLGLRTEGDVQLLQAHGGLANPHQMLHGGVSLAASEAVAARSRIDSGCSLPTSSVHIVHTRGVPVDAPLVLHTETRHAGRTLWVSEVVGTVGGKVCTVATVSAQA